MSAGLFTAMCPIGMRGPTQTLVASQIAISAKLLADIISKQDHKLRHLLPPPNKCAEYLLSFECLYVKRMNKELLHKSYSIA